MNSVWLEIDGNMTVMVGKEVNKMYYTPGVRMSLTLAMPVWDIYLILGDAIIDERNERRYEISTR